MLTGKTSPGSLQRAISYSHWVVCGSREGGRRLVMVNSAAALPIKIAFAALAISLPFSSTTTRLPSSFLSLLPKPIRSHSSSPLSTSPPTRKSLASDLLLLLGSRRDAEAVDSNLALQIRSCFRFLVPLSPPPDCRIEEENRLVWWPPESVMEIARIAVDSGGDPGAMQRELDPTMFPVPDVEGLKKDKCELTRTPYGRRFVSEELNSYLAFLFEIIISRGPSVGLNVSLSRYDLFHGHMFVATNTGRLGILFHAKEYPAYDEDLFPINMGYCQRGSDVPYDVSMNLRNILWLAPLPSDVSNTWLAPGVLVVLDAHPGGIIYEHLVPEYVDYVRTIYEDDFGDLVADVNYLNVFAELHLECGQHISQ